MICCATASFYSVWFIFMLLSGANETKSIPNISTLGEGSPGVIVGVWIIPQVSCFGLCA